MPTVHPRRLQAIYDTEATVKLLHEYGALCRYKNVQPTKVILTFAPCGREKTMKFIRWLGVHVPAAVEERILGGSVEERKARTKEQNVGQSVQILCDCLRTILLQTASCGVPLGVSVESVSIFKEEIDAAHELFVKLQVREGQPAVAGAEEEAALRARCRPGCCGPSPGHLLCAPPPRASTNLEGQLTTVAASPPTPSHPTERSRSPSCSTHTAGRGRSSGCTR